MLLAWLRAAGNVISDSDKSQALTDQPETFSSPGYDTLPKSSTNSITGYRLDQAGCYTMPIERKPELRGLSSFYHTAVEQQPTLRPPSSVARSLPGAFTGSQAHSSPSSGSLPLAMKTSASSPRIPPVNPLSTKCFDHFSRTEKPKSTDPPLLSLTTLTQQLTPSCKAFSSMTSAFHPFPRSTMEFGRTVGHRNRATALNLSSPKADRHYGRVGSVVSTPTFPNFGNRARPLCSRTTVPRRGKLTFQKQIWSRWF